MLKYDWTHKDIICQQDIVDMVDLYLNSNVTAAAIDTETTGLHIIYDRPFLFQCGWTTTEMKGYTYAVDLFENYQLALDTIDAWNAIVKASPALVGWNLKFDLHMLWNIDKPYWGDNATEGQCWLRLGADAIPDRAGGVNLKLKSFASQYIDSSARTMEKKLDEEKSQIASGLNLKLKNRLHWTKKKIDDFFNDKVHDVDDLPAEAKPVYLKWLEEDVPDWLRPVVRGAVDKDDIRYDKLNRANVIYYAHLDIVWTLEAYHKLKPIVEARGNMDAMNIENAVLYPTLRMERAGLSADFNYLHECKAKMKEYILSRREDLNRLAGKPLKCTQSKEILELLKGMGIDTDTTNSEALSIIKSDLQHKEPDNPAIEFIETLQELRTLEKWYSVYICRFDKDAKRSHGKIYTSINNAGTVSGRVTSDFQQFPKAGIVACTGEELFHPRKFIKAVDGDYKGIVYLDYSALELRVQTFYTILVAGGDFNMCRAYSPWQCHLADGTKYDYKNYEHIQHALDWEWFQDEDNQPWQKVDLHGATTKMAFDIDESHPDFHDLRYVGKRVNFAKNYGGSLAVIQRMFPEYSDEQQKKINDAYYKAFPKVEEFHKWVRRQANTCAYVPNLLGVRYYGADAHHLCNMLVQGSGAYFVKCKICEVEKYLQDHNCKSKLIMQIHDEVQLAVHKDDDPQIFFDIQKILGTWNGSYVPFVSDMELTTTTWANKIEVETIEQFKEIMNGKEES